ncbi:MAG TPA: phosphotransferase [Acholeplasma sp.]|jgi:thiamine kinase-like enzyme|nr:phosphotransferase [Acholeplasma sp.]
MNELIITTAAKALNIEENDIKIVKRLLGGMSHFTYHIQAKDIDYTIRLIGKAGNLYVDRVEELENIKRIIPLGLNNETVFFDTKTGVKIAKYIPGTVLTELDIMDHLPKIAETLKKLHNSKIEPFKDYELKKRLERYESYINCRSEKYLELKSKWFQMYEEVYQKYPKVFCHNDAQRSNMVLANNQLYLLDWEYAALNDPYYDIASFGNVKFDDALMLLEAYLERKPTKSEADHVRFYRMYQALQWHQVALNKEAIGLSEELHFDFKLLAEKYLNLAHTLYLEMKGD